jgi:hypothetical protein
MRLQCVLPVIVAVSFVALSSSGEDTPISESEQHSNRTILASFDKGDPGWQVRMQSLVRLARVGPDAVPDLIEALTAESPTTREFAAQALAMFADPAAQPALEAALTDEYSRVRIYAIRALSMLGPLKPAARYEEIAASDPNYFGVRSMADLALRRKDQPNPAALRKTWASYDLAKRDSARVGDLAPEFSLAGHSGKTHQLSDFRGKTVVLTYFLFDY